MVFCSSFLYFDLRFAGQGLLSQLRVRNQSKNGVRRFEETLGVCYVIAANYFQEMDDSSWEIDFHYWQPFVLSSYYFYEYTT